MDIMNGTRSLKERTIQLKARVLDLHAMEKRLFDLTESLGTLTEETDYIFNCRQGRLKLRTYGDLMYYERQDIAGPKVCDVTRLPVIDALGIKEVLSAAIGELGVVRKFRRLYTYRDNVRIHLDEVEGIGFYVEADIRIDTTDESMEMAAKSAAKELIERLEIQECDLKKSAYVDLIMQRKVSYGKADSDSGCDENASSGGS